VREYTITYHMGSARAVPDSTLEALMQLRSGDASLVYLYLLRNGGKLEPEQAQLDLGLDAQALEYALASLQRIGVLGSSTEEITPVTPEVVQPVRSEEYSRFDVENALEQDREYRWLNVQAEKYMGRVLTMPEYKRLLYIRQQIQLPFDVTACLMTHLAQEAQKRGRALSITTLQHKAADWAAMGIDSMEKADRQIEREGSFWSLWRALGMGERVPVKREEETIRGWLHRGYAPELVLKACEETVYSTGKLKWAYADKILERWQTRGYRTPEDVERGEALAGSQSAQSGGAVQTDAGFASAEAEAAYNERMRKLYEESRRENAGGE